MYLNDILGFVIDLIIRYGEIKCKRSVYFTSM